MTRRRKEAKHETTCEKPPQQERRGTGTGKGRENGGQKLILCWGEQKRIGSHGRRKRREREICIVTRPVKKRKDGERREIGKRK